MEETETEEVWSARLMAMAPETEEPGSTLPLAGLSELMNNEVIKPSMPSDILSFMASLAASLADPLAR